MASISLLGITLNINLLGLPLTTGITMPDFAFITNLSTRRDRLTKSNTNCQNVGIDKIMRFPAKPGRALNLSFNATTSGQVFNAGAAGKNQTYIDILNYAKANNLSYGMGFSR